MNQTSSETASTVRLRAIVAGLIPAAVYLALVDAMRYVQDDTYITLSYARNLLAGNGPVFNVGEYVEGFTSLLWMLLSTAAISISDSPAHVLQLAGSVAAIATCFFTVRITRRLLKSVGGVWRDVLSAGAGTWLAACSAFQFWSTSGMEATLFMLLVAGMVDAYQSDREGMQWVGWGAVALLTRPEAMLVVGFIVGFRIVEAVQHRGGTLVLRQAGILSAVLVALEVWRWQTFGSLLPNTFSAKTTTLDVQIADGLDYAWLFIRHVMAYGAGIALAALGIARTRSRHTIELGLIAIVWGLAVVGLGGDVLRHQRFLLPVAMLLAPLMTLGLVRVLQMLDLGNTTRMAIATSVMAGLAIYAAVSERDAITKTIYLEGELVEKMRSTGLFLRDVATKEQRTLTVAASTIGALKWWSEQTVVDMLGLTDRTIAKHPVRIPEVSDDASVAWKERNYNADYVLGRRPDYIVFSTGMKPSAFAERALFAKQFYVAYYQYYYPLGSTGKLHIMYRRKPQAVIDRSPQRTIDLTTANLRSLSDYARAIQLLSSPNGRAEAESVYRRITTEGPANFSGAWQQLSDIARDRGDYQNTYELARRAISIDPCDIRAHFSLFQYYRYVGNAGGAAMHADWVARCNPILFREVNLPVPEGAY